ncbi:MAG: hypothetical protein ACT4PG_02780 [Panacagrimonas sp.]
MPTPPDLIPASPLPAPLRSDPQEVFDEHAESHAIWQSETLAPAINDIAENIYDNAVEAAASAVAADASADAALASQTAASGSASAASASAAAASASLVSTQQIYDQFDDRYLGPKSADPSVDNDGQALADGAFYINVLTGALRAYTAANGWVQGVGAVAGVNQINGRQGDVFLPVDHLYQAAGVI